MKNKIFQSRDLCLRTLDTNSACAKSVRRNEKKMINAIQELRRKLHEIPEPSMQEHKTRQLSWIFCAVIPDWKL